MAVWTSKPHTREVLGAASIWREQCLLGTGSLFGDGPLWTSENFTAFKSAFVDHPIIGPATFVDKLKEQLAPASPDVKRLAAECLWLLYLFVSSDQFGEELKRERVSTFWELGGTPLPQSPLLSDEALSGLARPGTAFNTKVPDELTYLVELLLAWKTLPTDDASELLQGPWRLCSWVSNVAGSDKRAFRHMFLYFAFPEAFERSCSWSHKRRILSTLGDGIPSPDAASGSLCDVDRALLELRKKLEQQYGTEEIDFYVQPLRARWLEKGVTLEEGEHRPNVWVEKTIVKGRADRMEGDNALGRALWSPQRSKSDGDIYANMRRVRAGDIVLHLTDNEAITGVSIADAAVDDTFMGVVGTEWGAQPSYRVQLRDFQRLAPLLSRAVFLESEPFATELRELIASVQRASSSTAI